MKNQEKQRSAQASLFMRALIFGICACLTLSFGAFAVDDAPRGDILAENYKITEEYSNLLSEESNRYSELDTSAQKAVSKSVLNLLNIYRKELLDLQSHPDVSARLLSKEAKLSYTKGVAASRAAWIYFYNLPNLSSTASELELKSEYESALAAINAESDSAVLAAKSDLLCSRLNYQVYSALIRELSLDGDSLASASIIAGGVAELEQIDSPDLFAKEHAEVYLRIKSALLLQRARDSISAELSAIYKIVRAGSDYSSDQAVALFTYKIKNAESVAEMNAASIS